MQIFSPGGEIAGVQHREVAGVLVCVRHPFGARGDGGQLRIAPQGVEGLHVGLGRARDRQGRLVEDVGEVGLRIGVIQFAGLNQRGDASPRQGGIEARRRILYRRAGDGFSIATLLNKITPRLVTAQR